MPQLIPVDHDPFATPAAPDRLVPGQTYKPGNVTFADEPPFYQALETGHEYEDQGGNGWNFDLSHERKGNLIHGTVSNLKPADETAQPLGKVQQYKLRKELAAHVTENHLADEASGYTEVMRRRAMKPEQRIAEDKAIELAAKMAEEAKSDNIFKVVDKLVATGWRPEVNQYGGWKRPPEIAGFASPAAGKKIEERLGHHGISLEKPAPRLVPVDHDPFAQ